MASDNKVTGYKLPIDPARQQGTVAQGFVTPKQDRMPQVQSIPPKRVLPIVFIPGIMGSNLRMNKERQLKLALKSNIAWRPDHLRITLAQRKDDAATRQNRLDPETTELDTYDPSRNLTGNPGESDDDRNDEVRISFVYSAFKQLDGPLLQNDLQGTSNRKTKDQKARERGWGEVYFSSYSDILSICEAKINSAFTYGSMDVYLEKAVADISPEQWHANSKPQLKKIDEQFIKNTVKGCWFPVHAMGYNWLKGNSESGTITAKRITALIKKYQDQGFQCEKVILVTHSMGGLVARAIIHPQMGNLHDKVLGIIHGVMPATGAGTAYKRVRCGFEGSGIPTDVLGATGENVTPVLANSQGGLELLPSEGYGNQWLQIKQKDKILKSLPQNGDPYEEIYKVRDKWFGLLREQWINPAKLPRRGFESTCELLDRAKEFHAAIANTFHDQSYAHYGADKNRVAWHKVVWEISADVKIDHVDGLLIRKDNSKGELHVSDPARPVMQGKPSVEFKVNLLDAAEPGDQTAPVHSADAQMHSGKFKGIFRQKGYEHQSSYSNSDVLASTIYCLLKISSTMKWSK